MIEVYNRMSVEFEELNTRYLTLADMLDKPQPSKVSDKQWKLLQKQVKHMKKYRKVLAARMDDLYPVYVEAVSAAVPEVRTRRTVDDIYEEAYPSK